MGACCGREKKFEGVVGERLMTLKMRVMYELKMEGLVLGWEEIPCIRQCSLKEEEKGSIKMP